MENKNLKIFCIQTPCKFSDILKKMNQNLYGIVFIINKKKQLIGSISDGDIRRNILQKKKNKKIVTNKFELINKKTVFCNINDSKEKILEKFSNQKPKIRCIPLLNEAREIIDISFLDRLNSIPLLQPFIDKSEIKNVLNCLQTGWLSSKGVYVKKFEQKFTNFIGGGYGVAVTNGTAALELALTSLGIGKGDEVIVPNFTFGASINAVINIGAKPVVADIDEKTWTISIKEINSKMSRKTKAILAVHIYGLVCDLKNISKIAKKNKIFLVEDCAEALGSKFNKKYIGNYGDCSTFSFYPNKTITTGEGGMIVFKKKNVYEKSLILRNQGREINDTFFIHKYRGFNFRMSNIQAAIGYAQMFKIKKFLNLRKKIFKFYNKVFKKYNFIGLMPDKKNTQNSGWLYTIKIKNINHNKRNQLIQKLKDKGIEARPAFYPLNKMKPFKKYCKGEYEASENVSLKSISLPSSPFLLKKELNYITKTFLEEINKIN